MPEAASGGPVGGLWTVVLRRARTQLPLLAAVLAALVTGATLLGTCALLATTAQRQVLVTDMATTSVGDVAATVRVVLPDPERAAADAADTDPGAVLATVSAAVEAALAPADPVVSAWLASVPLRLGNDPVDSAPRRAYLLDADDVEQHAQLVSGRWPTAATGAAPVREVALPAAAAAGLRLAVGDALTLTVESEHVVVDVLVVGVFSPALGDASWARDVFRGAGVGTSDLIATYGPLVVAPGTLVASGVPIDQINVTGTPDLSVSDAAGLARIDAALAGLPAELDGTFGKDGPQVVVQTPLRTDYARARTEQGVTASGIAVVALLGGVLAVTTLILAVRLLLERRAAETALLLARGADRRRLAGPAAGEAALLALVASALSVPAALGTYRLLARVPRLADAGLAGVGPTGVLLAVAIVGAAAPATMLVVPVLRRGDGPPRSTRRAAVLARSGADLVLVGVAVLAYLQLRGHTVTTGAGLDPVLVAAPPAVLLAASVVALRVLPVLTGLGERRARGSRGLVTALAAWHTSRRPHVVSGAFLLVLATAAGTAALSVAATWTDSQRDQADAQIGADLVVTPSGAVDPLAQGPSLASLTGSLPAPVTSRSVLLGTHVSDDAEGPTRLLALDTSRADELLRGRLPSGASWSAVTAGLAADVAPGGPLLPQGGVVDLVVTGSAADGTPLSATPTLVVQDSTGVRVPVTGPPVALDGAPHEVRVDLGAGHPVDGDLRLVAFELSLDVAATDPGGDLPFSTRVTAEVEVLGAHLDDDDPLGAAGTWTAAAGTGDGVFSEVQATQAATSTGVVLRTEATVVLVLLAYSADDGLVALAFPLVGDVPVVVTDDLADQLGLTTGSRVGAMLDGVPVSFVVTASVPYLPSMPRGAALLADSDVLSRALLGQHGLQPLTDAWWVPDPPDPRGAATAVTSAQVGTATLREARADELVAGPLRAPLRAVVLVLVLAALVLALAGTAARVAAELDGRSVEVARMRGMGVPRAGVVRALLLEHGAVTFAAVLTGAVVGALSAWLVGPLLAVSSEGRPAVPPATFRWPWPAEAGLLGALLVGAVAVVVPLTLTAVRRATSAHLRMGVAP